MAESPPPDRSAGIPVRISSHALDVLLKLEAEHLVALLPARFGLPLAPIRRHLPTELPQLDLHLDRLDRVFELEDDTILNLEFEAALSLADLRRFLGYGLGLLDAYPGKAVQTVVLCGPRTRTAAGPIDLAPLPYRLTCVLIGDGDGEATLARLRALAATGQPWSQEDRLDLALLPVLRHGRDTEAVVREGLELARALPAAEQPRAIGALLALAYHYAGEAVLNRLVEGLMSTNLLEQIFAEQLEQRFTQGQAEGRAEGQAEGRAEEARLLLRRYLKQRFGTIPPDLEARMASLDAEALTALFDRALTASTIDAL